MKSGKKGVYPSYKLIQLILLVIAAGNVWGIDVPIRGGDFFGTPERFNRYYTDPQYSPSKTIYVSPNGNGSGTQSSPMSVSTAFDQISKGDEIRFLQGQYAGCWELDSSSSGTYDEPLVIKADPGVTVNCCDSGRKSCFNLEYADYVAIDGFTLEGGDYGVRTVGGNATGDHQKGVAILNNHGQNQYKDPFFSGGSDWIVVDNNIANGAGSGDGHGIYLSNGGDWMIVRNNELYDNYSADFQINADPEYTCSDVYAPNCDGSALNGLGDGITEFVLLVNNYFHDGRSHGPNFTSVRNSVVSNNIIGLYPRHGTSFWQETDNPNLGSSNNVVVHNLFIGEDDWAHVLQFINHSKNNTVQNNVFLGVSRSDTTATANSRVLLLEQDSSTQGLNTFAGNYFVGGYFENFTPASSDQHVEDFNPDWYTDFPVGNIVSSEAFKPIESAPFLKSGDLLDTAPLDRAGTPRINPADLGPWQVTLANPCIVEAEVIDTMVAPYVCEALQIDDGFKIAGGGDVTFEASLYIHIGKDFQVEPGGVFNVQMSPHIP